MNETMLLERVFTDFHKGRAGHINIQHYAQLVSDATHVLIDGLGMQMNFPLFALEEKYRFRAELSPGDCATVTGEVRGNEPNGFNLIGSIARKSDGKPVCTYYRELVHLNPRTLDPAPWIGLSPSATSSDEVSISDIRADFDSAVLNEYPHDVGLEDVDEHSVMRPQALWHLMTEALWAVQNKLGADQHSLAQKKIGGGATVFQLEHKNPISQGARLLVATHVVGYSESSLRMRHDIRDLLLPDKLFVSAKYVLTFFERNSGRRCPLGDVLSKETLTALPKG